MNKPSKNALQQSKLILEELEERRLFSGGIEGLIATDLDSDANALYSDIDGSQTQTSQTSGTAAVAEQQSQEVVFVDAGVDNYQQLVDDLLANEDSSRNIEVVVLDQDKDGIEEISDFLSDRDDLDAVHIISHGDDGSIQLGNTELNADTLQQNNLKIALWANSFAETGDILIYGCNLAETEAGQSLINDISSLTLADVAASTDLTGAADEGGDWALEFTVGQVESKIAVSAELQQEYQGTFATYTVTSLADSGAGSLREAISQANASGGADTIEFGVAGTISLSSALPTIDEQLAIDGSTAPGYSGDPVVELDGSGVSGNGLHFTSGADASTVNALMITNFTGNGIQIDNGADGISITGNWIGTTGTGTTGDGNSNNGINVQGANTVIGGTGANDGNVITNNGNEGINVTGSGATGTVIQGNIIGLDPDGSTGSGNGDVGIVLLTGADNTTIGGTDPNAGNVISMNFEGIEINSNNNTIQGNYIGTDITGTLDRGNRSDDGIEIKNNATGNLIGGTEAGAGNLIAFNSLDGINLVSGSGNTILGNDIYSNGDQDIDVGPGVNNDQAAPVLVSAQTSGSELTVSGSLSSTANSYFRIEFFGADQTYLGFFNVATDGSGNASFETTLSVSVASGTLITSSATKSDASYATFSDTSAYSSAVVSGNAGTAIWRDASTTPQASDWDGTAFGSTTASAPSGDYRIMQGAESPTRDEIIVIGATEGGEITGEIWDGTSWSVLPGSLGSPLGTVSQNYWWGMDVQYESQSGDALLVWTDGSNIEYATWDGTSWSAVNTISYGGATPRQLQLAASPDSDEMVLVVSDSNSSDRALVWDGTSWGNEVLLDAGSGDDRTDVNVVYQQQSGDAVVVYGAGSINLQAQVWDGASWGSPLAFAAPAGTAGDVRWTTVTADPNSDNIAVGVVTSSSELWVGVLDGVNWTATEMSTTSSSITAPTIGVGFESTSGDLLAAYAESGSSNVKYQTWTSAGGWSGEQLGPNIGGTPNSLTLSSDPLSDGIMLAAQDSNSHVNYVLWDGTSWGAVTELGTSTTETKNQPFLFLWDQQAATNEAPVNNLPAAQSTDEDTTLTFSVANSNPISISNDPGAITTVTLSVDNGTLTLAQTTGLTIDAGADGSATMTVTGTVEDINAALDGLQYTPTTSYVGGDTLTLVSSEDGTQTLDIDSNLLGRYQFEAAAPGGDSSPGGTNGAILVGDAAITTDAERGDVVSLDGSGDYVQIAGLYGEPASLTLSAWVDFTGASRGEVISLGDRVLLRADDWFGAGVKASFYNGSGHSQTQSGQNISGTGWHHLAYSFDDVANTQTLYIDGVAVATTNHTASISYAGGGANTVIGINGNSLSGQAFQGSIDDARIYDRSLTASEIADLAAERTSDSDSLAITVNPVNDAPTLVNNTGLTAAEGSTTVITNAELGYNDAQQPATSIVYTVTTSPANGQLELTTNPDVAITSFTQDDIDNSRVVYVHDGSETIADSFGFSVDDGQGHYASGSSILGIGTLTNVTNGISNAQAPDYSPDGSQIVFARNNDIYIMDADGSNQTPLVTAAGGDFQAVWSPDGSKIAFTSNRDGNNEIYVIDVDGNNETRITTTTNLVSDSAPAWSPDGSQIAFTSDRDGDKEIWVMDADGNNLVQLTTDGGVDGGASWSPDGSKIVFQSTRDGGDYEIWVMDADGNNQTRLTSEAGIDALGDWSPDGSKLLFYSERDGNREIYVMDADGNNPVRLTNDADIDMEAEWSPDGSSILFSSNRDGDYDIYSANVIYENTFDITVTAVNDAPTFIDGAFGNWSFDEGSGDSVGESAIGISGGTLGSTAGADANDPTWTSGVFGQALHFDGVDDYVEIADAPGIDISGPEFSASLWMNPDSGPNTEDMLFMKGDRTGDVNYYLSWKDTNVFTWAFREGGVWHYQDMPVTTMPTTGEWNHIGITFDRPTVTLYVNGDKYVFDNVATGGSMDNDLTANDDVLWIGAGRSGGSLVGVNQFSGPFAGSIDELALFDRALTDADMEAIRTSAPPVVTASAFSLDENSVNNTVAGTVAAYDPDVGDTLSYAITAGNTGGAFSIDANGVIRVANSAALDFETNPVFTLTVEATDDGSPNLSDTTVVTITLNNVAPTISASGAATVNEGEVYTLNLSATEDVSSWTINWGDGTIDTIAGNPSSVTHTYTNGGFTNNITVAATDSEGTYFDSSLLVGNASSGTNGFALMYGFDPSTGTADLSGVQTLDTPTPSNLDWAQDVVVGPNGNIYVSGYESQNIIEFDSDGNYIREIVSAPNGITTFDFGPDGNIYVASDSLWVKRYDGSTGAYIDDFLTGLSFTPEEIEFGPDGNLYIGDYNTNSRIWRYDLDGNNLDGGSPWIDPVNGSAEDILRTQQITWGPDGNIYVASQLNGFIQRYDGTTGAFIDTFANPGVEPTGWPRGPTGVAFGPDGNLYVVKIDTIMRFDGTTGAYIDDFVPSGGALDNPWFITFTPNHQVYVSPDTLAVITGDTSYSGNEGDAVAGDLNATDVDGLTDGTYFTVTTPASNGATTIDATTGAWTFTPTDPNWFGSDSFTVTVTDDLGGTTTQVVNITLANVNDPVIAVDDSYSVSEDAAFSSGSEWFDSNWSYSRTLSFDNSTRTENLVDFPVLVKLDSSVIDYARTHDQGWDLRFFDQDGTALAHEVELWDEGGTSYVWVKIPQIDASSSTDSIVMYYGNAGVADSGEDSAGVWSDYRAAYHLNEDPGATGTVTDAAGSFDAVNAGSTDTAGIIGNAQDFDGAGQYIDLGDNRSWINNASGATLSIWMNADTTTGSGDLIGLTRNDPADTGASRITLIRNGDDIMLIARTMDDSSDSVSVTTATNPLAAGSWHHITGTVDYASDVDNIKIYVDGQLEGTFSHNFTLNAIPNTDSSHAVIGADEDGASAFFDGQLDEARVADQLRSADWVSAQYAAMTGTLVDIGAEQTVQGVLINDVDADRDVLTVTELNGVPAAIGVATPLSPSGAIVTLNADGSFTYDTNGAFESLGAGDSTTDSFTYTVIDGNGGVDTATVTMTITGVDDTPTIGGTDTGAVQEDVAVVANNISTTGTLTITDPDTGESTFQAETVTGTYGDLTIDTAGNWTYAADNTQAAIQQLDVSESLTDTLTVTSFDGTTHNVVITINGSEDASVISGTTTGSVTEDGTLTSSGALTITDTDSSDTPSFADLGVTSGDNGYGTFEMMSGTWTYTLDNNDPAVQALDVGETLTDTHTFTATDGSTQQVTITINGAEDAPVIGGVATGTVAEDGTLTASDTLTITDADTSDNPISFNDVAATLGDNGYGDFEITSNTWTYTLNNGHAAVQALDAGETLTDTHTFTASDGSTQTVTVTINGAEDAPVIGGVATGTVAEDGTLTASDTLTITDADTSDNPISFNDVAATLGDNGYGDFEITSNTWTYTLNNGHASVQALDAGETLTDTYTFTASDGSTQTVTVTINGAEDAPVIGGVATGTVAEDGTMTASDTLTITDADASDNPISFNDVAATLGDNGYGDFEITSNTWTYTLNNGHAAVQSLDAGETLTDTYTFTASDGSTQTVTVTINGAEDAPVFDSTAVTAATEDAAYSYTITTSDVDVEAVTITAPTLPAWLTFVDNGDGTATLSGTPTNAEVGSHNVVLTVSDGTLSSNQNFTIIVGNTNDPAVIGGTDTGAVQEDVAVVSNNISTTGTLTITDPDTGESTFQAETVTGTYGDLTIDAAGNWTYTADNTQAAIQQLDALESLTDTLTVTSFDGTMHNVVITINGSEDAAVISGTTTGSVTEDGTLTSSGALTISDTDSSDTPSFADVGVTAGDNGYGSFEMTSGTWTYTLDNNDPAVQALDAGETLTDTHTFTATDGSTQQVTITINGAEDAPVIGGVATGTVAEDGTLTASDTLTITDADTSDNPISFNNVAATLGDNGYGDFEITSNTWTYTLNNGHAAVQALDAGQTLTDTYTFTASDGSTQTVTVTINGAEDAPVIGGVATGTVAEDGTLTASDTLTITDTDTSDNPISFNDVAATLGDNGYGDFEITSNTWTYTLNNGHAAVQALDAGQTLTDTYTFTASDGSTQTVTVTINGAEDAPVIGGVATGTVAEDGTLTASDTLTITDADTSDNPISFNNVTATLGDNGYGDFEMTSNTWTYTLNNGHAAVQALDAGQTLTDTYTFTASDGSTQTVTVTINGAEDAPVIGGVATGTVAEDGTLTASDTLTITDADTSDNPISFNDVAATLGDNGYGDFEITGNTWTYTLNNGHAAVQALDAGESLNDTYTFTASDGSTQTVTVTINGAEDAPVFDSAAVTAATEDAAYSYTITTSDVDVEAVTITAPTLPGWLTFVDNGDGTATLSGTPTNAEVGSHNVVLTVSDGTLSSNQNFTIVVGNTNDPAVIGGTDTGSVQEDVSVVANNISTTGTLTISDPDTGESTFQAATINGTYGDLTIDAAGNWTYTADNTQAAIQQLDVTEFLTDTLTVTSFDGTTHNVVITINGSEDAAVISGTPTGSVTEDGTLTSSGALTISDTDTSDTPSFADVGVTAGDNGYGTFEMTSGTWTYTLDNNDPAVQALDAGETLTDTHTFTATDGSTQQVTITINGAEDTPVFDSTAVTAATEDLAYSYTITTSDVDVEAVTITAPTLPAWLTFVDNGDGTATLSGTPTNAEVGSHNVVLTVSDGTLSSNQNFTIIVGNTNDPAVIGGTDTGAVQEDVAVVSNNISTTGTLTITDPDTGESTFQAETVTGTYGDLTIDGAGNWTYTADNTQAAIQQLDTLENITDTLTVTSFDGTTHNVVITINGSEDTAVISGTTTGSVTEDGTLTSSGTLTITDTDSSDPTSFVDVAPQAGDNGHGTFEITSNTWTYVLDNNDPAVQALDVGETLTDTYTFTAPDGETQLVTVTINGAEDAAVIGGVASGSVTEDGALTVSDILTITDVDSSDNPVSFNDLLPTLGDNGYGNFEITGNTWTYTLNNTHAAVQGLDVGETLTDTYTFIASDGSPSLVIVTIDGAEDLPILGGVTIGAVSEDGPLVTSNTLTITDTDSNDNPISFNDLLPTLGDNGYGNFEITGNTWIFTLNNAHAAVQGLDAGESFSDSFTFTASDGSTQLVSVTINGAEDAPTLDNAIADQTATQSAAFNFTFAANTFGDLDASDTLTYTATLSDSSPLPAWLSFDGATRTFSGTPGAGDVGAIDIRITADDASSTITDTFTLTVDPFNSLPVIGGADRGALTEDLDVVDGQIAASGALTIVDADAGESSFVAGTINGALGSLTIDASGNWSYSADNSNPEIQALQAGQTITEALTVTTADGSTHEVIVTINGTQEAAPPPVVEPPVVEPPPEEEIPPPEEETKDEGSGGEDEILPEITPLPQGSPTAVPEHDESDPVAADEPEGEVVNFGPAIDKQTPAVAQQPQVLQAQNLEVDSLTLQVSDDEALNEQFELELLNRIDSMHLGMDSDASRQSADDVNVQIVVGSTASLTVGIVSWVLRGGALLASFMSTVPLLNRFDPLPILKTREDEEDVEPDEDDDTGIDEHAKKVDNMFSGKDAEQS